MSDQDALARELGAVIEADVRASGATTAKDITVALMESMRTLENGVMLIAIEHDPLDPSSISILVQGRERKKRTER